MGWNDAYWRGKNERISKAKRHHEEMLKNFPEEIKNSVNNTKTYSPGSLGFLATHGNPDVSVDNADTVSAVFKYNDPDKRTIVLNFASYKNPGGGFMQGSSAQEESLCHESTLYEVLSDKGNADYYEWNNRYKNKALYLDRALLSKDVLFMRDGKTVKADVLTCAAPNCKAYMDYIPGANKKANLDALDSRIRFIRNIIAAESNVGTIILGAFGCGVFGQNPETVARLFMREMESIDADRVVYAVIDKGGHSKEGAYATFKRVQEEFENNKGKDTDTIER